MEVKDMLLSIIRTIKIIIPITGKDELEKGLKELGINVGKFWFKFYDPRWPRENPREEFCRYFVEGSVEQEELDKIIKYLKEDYRYTATLHV